MFSLVNTLSEKSNESTAITPTCQFVSCIICMPLLVFQIEAFLSNPVSPAFNYPLALAQTLRASSPPRGVPPHPLRHGAAQTRCSWLPRLPLHHRPTPSRILKRIGVDEIPGLRVVVDQAKFSVSSNGSTWCGAVSAHS